MTLIRQFYRINKNRRNVQHHFRNTALDLPHVLNSLNIFSLSTTGIVREHLLDL